MMSGETTLTLLQNNEKMWPEEESSHQGILSKIKDRLFYSYMNPILQKGSQLDKQRKSLKRHLNRTIHGENNGSNHHASYNNNNNEEGEHNSVDDSDNSDQNSLEQKEMSHDDLFRAPQAMYSQHLLDKFNAYFTQMKKEKLQDDPTQKESIIHRRKQLRWILMKTLWHVSKPTYIPAGIAQLVTVLVQVSTPIVVQRLLILFQNNPNSSILSAEGIILAIVLFLCSIIDGLAQERHKFLAFQSGITIRAAAVNVIYNQMLNLSAKGKENLMSGGTTSLVAIDCQKLFEVYQEGHLIWSCPLSMIIVTVLLLLTLGKSTLVGMLTMILLIPLVKLVISKMMLIRRKRASYTDKRVEATTSMLQAMRFCKLNHYEEKFIDRVHEARRMEMIWVRKELGMLGWTLTITVLSPVIASALTFITYTLIDDGNILTSAETFTTLLLFSALRFPINYVGKLIGKAAQGIEACQRIADFLDRDTTNTLMGKKNDEKEENLYDEDENILIRVENGCFTVGSKQYKDHALLDDDKESTVIMNEIETPKQSKASFTVSNINFSVKKSEVLCVVGAVASGKSTLLNALVGDVEPDLECAKPKIKINGRVSYASQSPFILNTTFRENILFGSEYNKELYDSVILACNLNPDLKQLGPAGDLTEIGERGVTLSGGQKARISIARCVYAQPSVALFDDVLSALDASTGKWIFDHLFDTSKKKQRLLSNAAVILVTHASHFLSRVDDILVLNRGEPIYVGNWDGLNNENLLNNNDEARDIIHSLRSSVQEVQHSSNEKLKSDKNGILSNNTDTVHKNENGVKVEESHNALMTVEKREFGVSDWRTWLTWFVYAGGSLFSITTFISLFIDRGFYVVNELWLATWTSAAYEKVTRLGVTFPAQSEGSSAQYQFIAIYASILGISMIATAVRSQIIVQGGANCAEKLFLEVTNRVVYSPMSYFDTTPIGRILNRLTYDIETLDISLSQSMTVLLVSMGWFVTGVTLQISILPVVACVLLPVIVLYMMLLYYYRKSAVDLQRLDAVSRSPVQTRLAESMDGCTTIKVFGKINHFQKIFKKTVDQNSAAMMNFMASQRWLGSRFQVLGSVIVLFATLFVVSFNDRLKLETGIVAMLIIWSSNFTITLSFFSQGVSETEAYLTSVERLKDMTDLEQEKEHKTSASLKLEDSWPSEGNLEFENVCLRYRPNLPLALNGLSFTAEAGRKIGICGRTGAGKSTISAALFRLCEIESGKITLDGRDLSTLGMADVRGRRMCIIPQDPVLFSGSLRECLDPWGLFSDDEILDALQTVQVADAGIRGLNALKDFVDEGGRNYSVGERQLLCLARAILTKPKVLLLDEATASVDGDTDAFIQKMIRERFVGTTLLTIAHRLNTIMDYDMVLVIEKGKVAEYDTPRNLLKNENGLFSELVDSTGAESSLALRQIANNAK